MKGVFCKKCVIYAQSSFLSRFLNKDKEKPKTSVSKMGARVKGKSQYPRAGPRPV
jgi:hypothetical protein